MRCRRALLLCVAYAAPVRLIDHTAISEPFVWMHGRSPEAPGLSDELAAPPAWPGEIALVSILRRDLGGRGTIAHVFPDLPDAAPLVRYRAGRWCMWDPTGALVHASDALDLDWCSAGWVELAITPTGYRVARQDGAACDGVTGDEVGVMLSISPALWLVILHDGSANTAADIVRVEPDVAAIARVAYVDPEASCVQSPDGRELACAIWDGEGPGYSVVELATGAVTTHHTGDRMPRLAYEPTGRLDVA